MKTAIKCLSINLAMMLLLMTTQAADDPSTDNQTYFKETFGIGLENIYWGEFHGHTNYSILSTTCQGAQNRTINNPRQALAYARDVQDFDFLALNDNAELPNNAAIPDDLSELSMWDGLLKMNLEYNNENSTQGKVFIVFPGYEYSNTYGSFGLMGSTTAYGHKNVIFKPIEPWALPTYRVSSWILFPSATAYAEKANGLWNHLFRYRPSYAGGESSALTIIHTPSMIGQANDLTQSGGGQDHRTDWSVMDPDFTRHVEICSQWGSSEGRVLRLADDDPEEDYYQYSPGAQDPLSVRNILYEEWVQKGDERYQLGFLGGTDNHAGKPGSTEPTCKMQYQGTVTGIVAPTLTRNALWSALWKRRTLACSTSPSATRYPIVLAAETGAKHVMMGDAAPHDGTIRLRALVSKELSNLELIVDGIVYKTFKNNDIDATITLPAGRHFVYLRGAFYEEGEKGMTWSSPVYFE